MSLHPVPPPPLGLYIHLPWCVRKCPYCDFNSHQAQARLPEAEYVSALLAELAQYEAEYSSRPLISLFFGGGTPSLFSSESIHRLLDSIARVWTFAHDIEITLEANPGTVETGKFQGFRAAGVNRLSIGIQSFDEDCLKRLGRVHDRDQALRAVDSARSAGFDHFNLDLMFGLPGQSLAQGLADLETALSLTPPHLSWYQLTLEPNTVFYKYPPRLPGDEAVWALQEAGLNRLEAAGYAHYEVSAHALSGFECRHNLNYWQFGDYLGIGAGAHGKLTDPATALITRTQTLRHPDHYLNPRSQTEPLTRRNVVPVDQYPFEFLMNHLRLRQGFDLSLYRMRTGLPLSSLEPGLSQCLADALLEQHGSQIRCTDSGWNFLDDVLQRFM
ncbi:MAG: radical SAM family heme chaperone HemW [Methylococcaceae bacterium]